MPVPTMMGALPPRSHRRLRIANGPGSELARRQAAVILEVLAGLRGTTDASSALGISPPRYYQLEARAVAGLVAGLEPRPKGTQPAPENVIARIQRDNTRLTRELARAQALVRVAQKAIGVHEVMTHPRERPAPPRSQRRTDRAARAIAALRQPRPAADTPQAPRGAPTPPSP